MKRDEGFTVRDRRGEESEVKPDPLTEGVKKAAEEIAKREVEMIRCPVCKSNRDSGQYLHNAESQTLVCLQCGGVFMQKQLAKRIWDYSIKHHTGVKVGPPSKLH